MSEILAVMSEREDGSMKLSQESDLKSENRKRFFEKNGIDEGKVIAAGIVHGKKVEIVGDSSPRFIDNADGLVTKEANIFLSVTVADCIPVYLYEPNQKIVGIVHCGWRGIVGGIIREAMDKILQLDGKLENLEVALGPGINKCHFEIKEDILDKFRNFPEFVEKRDRRIFVDLKGIIRKQLGDSGVCQENIEDNKECTMENDKYFSFRRDKPKIVEAMVALIGMKNS